MSSTSIGVNLRVTGHCSQGGRKYMEDFFSVAYQQSEDEKDLEYAFFGIYDGHGGSEAATYAKEHLMNEIVNQKLFWSDCDQDILRAIREGYLSTHHGMWREQEKWPKTATGLPSTAGTTASVAFIRRGKIYIGHVGDSGIVLGYQEEGEKFWRSKPLTHDHKPECNVEKARIINSGGKVVTKSGVPRVVWNRPKIGHKGPVRRSTPIDEIPFLAVARSLGDLWSYNSALNQFVVSPVPDVHVISIDPKSFRCLIFGTDGLWNVLSPSNAVDLARDAEIINERIACIGGASEWTNPSKCLVDKALENWCLKKMRADNTSVVTIMLDPPGAPKREVMKNYSTTSFGLECIQLDEMNAYEYADYPQLDNSTVSMYALDNHRSDNYSGCAIMTRYDNNCDSILYYENCNDANALLSNNMTSPSTLCNSNTLFAANSSSLNSNNELQYMNSFAESYNSLLISSYENNSNAETIQIENSNEVEASREYNNYNNLEHNEVMEHHPHSLHQQQHQYQQQCMSAEEGYSLTKLETRCEQQFRQDNQNSNKNAISQSRFSQYDNITSTYQHQQTVQLSPNNENKASNTENNLIDSEKQGRFCEPNLELRNELNKNHVTKNIDDSKIEGDKNSSGMLLDDSIQINEISSSVVETSILEDDLTAKNKIHSYVAKKYLQKDILPRTRSSIKMLYQEKISKNTSQIKINPHHKSLIEQNENILTIEPRKLRSTTKYSKRNLRSRDFIVKEKIKPANKKQTHIRKDLNNYLKLSNAYTKTRQIQQQVQDLQKRAKYLPLICRTADSSNLKKSKPKSCSSIYKSQSKISDISNSISSSSSALKRSLRNSAWCSNKSVVQTRNRVQNRISH